MELSLAQRHPVQALRRIARRAAAGDKVLPEELAEILRPLEPFANDFVYLRALQEISHEPDLDAYAVRRRLYHAARALATRFDLERIHEFPLSVPYSASES